MTFEEWEETVPTALRERPVWRATAYRKATFLAARAPEDVLPMVRDVRFGGDVSQLVKAVGSIGSNISEGYGRRSRLDRIKFYEYALGSAGESMHWYTVLSAGLRGDLLKQRVETLAEVSKLLLTMIRNEREGGGWNDSRRIPPRT